jgi:cytochrome c biogenesis protein CcmG/thiol:disulfide interchange protein DsbE
MTRFAIPVAIFVALLVLLGVGLKLDPREVPSPLIGKPAPHFELPQLHEASKTFTERDLRGKVWVLNVWASWCVSCREEHPVLLDLAASGAVPIYGLNYKDNRADGLKWLKSMGDPYKLSIYDLDGRVGIDYGVYGVPETYVIDKSGVIRYKRIGPLTPEIVKNTLAAKEAAPAAADPVLEKRVMTLAEELRCLVCQNQTLAESNAPLAEDLRNQVREKMREGKSDREVVDFLVERYGDFVLYRPPLKATTVLLWFGPLLLLAIGFAVLLRRVRRLRAAEEPGISDADRKRAAELLAGGEQR